MRGACYYSSKVLRVDLYEFNLAFLTLFMNEFGVKGLLNFIMIQEIEPTNNS